VVVRRVDFFVVAQSSSPSDQLEKSSPRYDKCATVVSLIKELPDYAYFNFARIKTEPQMAKFFMKIYINVSAKEIHPRSTRFIPIEYNYVKCLVQMQNKQFGYKVHTRKTSAGGGVPT
jgi:hypothetical protein